MNIMANERFQCENCAFGEWFLTGRFFVATGKWISNITTKAMALWCMIWNMAFGILCTNTGTWISTFIIHARKMAWAIAIGNTLWTTTAIWISEVFRQTFACAGAISFGANSVCTAWIGRTRTNLIIWTRNCWKYLR